MNASKLYKLALLLVIISSVLFYSCAKEEMPKSSLIIKDNLLYKKGSDVPFTGRERAFVENKIIEYDVKDGYKHGDFRIFSEDGILELQGQIDSNRNVGKWQYYYPSGEIESEGYFVNNVADGKWSWYHRDGTLSEEGIFQNGIRVGMWYQFNNSGEIIFEKNYDIVDSLNTKR